MKKIYLWLFLFVLSNQAFTQNYTVLGNASSLGGCNCFRLTPDANDQAGAIFQNQTIDLNNSFDFTFNAFLGCRNGNDAADGIVFVLTNNPQGLGSGGGGLGYGGSNQPFSIGVEFDTYQNSQDPSYDHIAIEAGGTVDHNVAGPVPALANSANIDNCQNYLVRIVWDVNSNTYSVYFDGVLRISQVIPNMVNTYFGGNPIVNWGWTAGTGGGTNDQQICVLNTSNWVGGVNYQSCNTTFNFQDISTSSLGSIASWAWNFGDGATSTSQNPSHTYAANGTYTVTLTITDQSGCTNTYSHPVTINAPITIAPTINQPPCNGGSNGGITTVVGGGFGPSAGYGGYTYHWSNNTVGSSLVGASAGTYTLTVTDGVCTTTGTYTVNQPTALTATTSHTDANCSLPNGTATITISGGTPPYNGVNWGPLPNMQGNTATGLGPGHYIADFHDANNCSALLQYAETIGSLPCGITSSTSVTNVLCRGASTGSATLIVTGSTGTPTITWNPGGFTGATISNKPAGTYTYTYTDANPAHNFNGSVTITEPPATMAVSLATVNMSCSASNDGQALASITAGGVSPFNYNWNPAGANAPVRSNLSAGAVSVTVTDANSCTASATGTITGPPTLTLNITKVDDSCYHSRTGSALANVSGGNPPYTFNWSNISSAQNNLSLGAGTYTVTVTDDKGCTITGSTTLSEPTQFTHTPLVPTNISCFGATTGAISTSAAGGTPGYTYSWNPATATGNNPTGLAAGQYNLTLTDAHNCTIRDSVVLTQPASALTVTTSHTNVSCNGGNNGSLTITVGGGTPPYSFLGNPVPAGTTVIPGRTAGTYAGNLTDANGCSVAVSETITEPAVLALGEQHINILCNGASTGAIDVTVGGGTTPYTFVWNGGSPTTEDRTAIPAGTYSVTVTDFNSCTATISATLTQPAALTISQTHVDVLCNGASTGSIDVTVGGGVAAYTYAWSDGPVTTEDRTAIPAGTYTVTATDQNVCTISVSATIAQPTALSVTTSHTDVKCHGGSDGTLTITVSGGTPPYSFLGNPVPAGTTVVPGRTAGTYAGNLTDANGCTFAVSETIAEPGVQSLTVSNTNEPCFGATVATASANFVNATGAVTYNWTGGLSGTPLNNLSAGTYDVTATDQNLCSVTGTVTVTQPAAPVMNVNVTNATCFGANGSATALPTGGTAPYNYTWSGGGSGATVAKPAGSYTVTATDASTCQQTASFVITQPIGMTVTKAHTNLLCFGDANGTITLTTTGGAGGPYTYAWSANANTGNSNAATQLTAGIYSTTITDANNCTTSISDTLTQPSQPVTITIDQHVITCYGANNGSISISTTGGTGPYTYNWNPNVTTDSAATNLGPANYGITITDANGCSLNTQINITEPSQPLNLNASQTNLTCFQSNDGTASVIANGGTAPYSFAWTPNVSSSFSASALAAGNYTLTVTDNNGCTEDTFFLITQPAQLTASGTPLNVLCNGNATGAVTITANGGTPAYSYAWSPNVSSADTVSGLTAGTYLVTVTDTHNCSVSVSTTVAEPALLTLSSTTTPATCYGTATGTITVIPAGGAGNYAFSATDGAAVYNSANGQFGNLIAGTYALAVTDQNSCSATGSATISQPDTLQAPFNVFPATCYHYTDGRIEVTPIGGTGGYNFSLSNGDANSSGNFAGLGAGTYSFTVTDVNGCTANGNGAITEPDSVGLTVSPNPVEVDLGNSLQITTTTTQTGTITYDWSPKFGLSCYDCADPVFNGVYSQPYTVVMTTDAGCKGIAQLEVTVIPKYDVFIPNVFTPNGDGANDFWQIFGNLPAFKQLQVMVFNRIGEKVFESNDINFKWDGTFKGQSAPPGVYSYVAKFVWLNNHSDSDYKGTITLLR